MYNRSNLKQQLSEEWDNYLEDKAREEQEANSYDFDDFCENAIEGEEMPEDAHYEPPAVWGYANSHKKIIL